MLKVLFVPVEQSADLNALKADSARPKYERIKEYLQSELANSRLLPGQALPSEAALGRDFNVARNTVRQAMAELERDGLIFRVQGKGTFVQDDVQQLRSRIRKQGFFALIMPESHTGHYPSLQRGFEHAASEDHTQVIVSTTGNDTARQGNIILQLISKEVAGVALEPPDASPFTPPFQVEMLQNHGIPVVFYHRRVEGVRAPLVSIPFMEVGRMAGRELLQRGHRRVAMCYTLPSHTILPSPSARDYAVGLREVLRQAGGDLPDEFILSSDTDTLDLGIQEKEVWPKLKDLLSRPDRPTAIMASYDTMGEIIYLAMERLGLRVPEDVSVISFGGKERRGAIIRRLTSVVIDGADIGRRAARLINEMCNGQRSINDTQEIQIQLELSDGQSLGQAPI